MMVLFAKGKGPKEVVIKPETLNEMISPQFGGVKTQGYGIGFGLSEHRGYQKIGHGGAIYGFSTQLYAIPEIKFLAFANFLLYFFSNVFFLINNSPR